MKVTRNEWCDLLPQEVKADKSFPQYAKNVYAYLRYRDSGIETRTNIDNHLYFYDTNAVIMKESNIQSKSTLSKAFTYLVENQWIIRIAGKHHKASYYTLLKYPVMTLEEFQKRNELRNQLENVPNSESSSVRIPNDSSVRIPNDSSVRINSSYTVDNESNTESSVRIPNDSSVRIPENSENGTLKQSKCTLDIDKEIDIEKDLNLKENIDLKEILKYNTILCKENQDFKTRCSVLENKIKELEDKIDRIIQQFPLEGELLQKEEKENSSSLDKKVDNTSNTTVQPETQPEETLQNTNTLPSTDFCDASGTTIHQDQESALETKYEPSGDIITSSENVEQIEDSEKIEDNSIESLENKKNLHNFVIEPIETELNTILNLTSMNNPNLTAKFREIVSLTAQLKQSSTETDFQYFASQISKKYKALQELISKETPEHEKLVDLKNIIVPIHKEKELQIKELKKRQFESDKAERLDNEQFSEINFNTSTVKKTANTTSTSKVYDYWDLKMKITNAFKSSSLTTLNGALTPLMHKILSDAIEKSFKAKHINLENKENLIKMIDSSTEESEEENNPDTVDITPPIPTVCPEDKKRVTDGINNLFSQP